MIFELETSCFQQYPSTFDLVELASFVLKGRHRIFVKDDTNADYLEWVEALPTDLFDRWELSIDLSVELEALEPARLTIKVCQTSQPDVSLSPPVLGVVQASRLASEPYRVFVENDDADRNFLLTFADSRQKAKIEELEANNLLRFEHTGGIGELKKKVVKFARKEPLYPTICSAVFDSDAPQPDDISTDAEAVEKVCKESAIGSFMLERRAIENYLLRSWLNFWINDGSRAKRVRHIDRFNGFSDLNNAQRAHFHMKKGLSVDSAKISDGTISIYDDVDEAMRNILAQGFGNDVGSDIYSLAWVQDSHPTEDSAAWAEVNGIVKEFLVLCR